MPTNAKSRADAGRRDALCEFSGPACRFFSLVHARARAAVAASQKLCRGGVFYDFKAARMFWENDLAEV